MLMSRYELVRAKDIGESADARHKELAEFMRRLGYPAVGTDRINQMLTAVLKVRG